MSDYEKTVEPLLDSLRDIACATPSSTPTSGALIARLKSINRQSNAETTLRKETTAEARTAIAAVNLRLENLMYEKRHLEREIDKCNQFSRSAIYHSVALHPVEEFLSIAPEEMRPAEAVVDDHQLMLCRLRYELQVRKELEERRKTLIRERDSVLQETKRFQEDVDKLADPFDKLTQTALQLQSMLNQLVPSPKPPVIELPAESPRDEAMEEAETTPAPPPVTVTAPTTSD